jgi:hypothetical protein
MRNLCLVFAFTVKLSMAAGPSKPVATAKTVPDTTQKVVAPKDTSRAAAPATAPATIPATAPAAAPATTPAATQSPAPASPAASPAPATPAATPEAAAPATPADTTAPVAAPEVVEPATPVVPPDAAAAAPAAPPAALATSPAARPLFNDYALAGRQYAFSIAGQAVAAALGFFIGSAIETAIVGEEEAHKGTLSFTGIRYDNGYGAFWGGSTGALLGSSLTVYFTGQSDEENGGYFWTLVGTGLAGAGALYAASAMGVNDDVDWKPFLPLLAIPGAGGVIGFNVSRWFNDRKRESIMGPDAGLRLHAPRFAWLPSPEGDRFQLQALNLSF